MAVAEQLDFDVARLDQRLFKDQFVAAGLFFDFRRRRRRRVFVECTAGSVVTRATSRTLRRRLDLAGHHRRLLALVSTPSSSQ